ncbi:hypothetical protein [Mycobacteroides abscessus]|uniref:hypothetical protein n=1 Tax=Mycobacteroides abscessus TaxID=36809 RepID=UPI001401DB94|nr:hypothetical protein [Mycobacteroides abscessus]
MGSGVWSVDELAVAADVSLSHAQVATRVGRSVVAVKQRRAVMRLSGQPVPEGMHGTTRAYQVYGCRCGDCVQVRRVSGQVLYRELREAERAELSAAGVDVQVRPWSDDELAVVLDRSVPRREAARRVGRTESAVKWARRQYLDGASTEHRWREWSPEELAVALDVALSTAQAAQQLGRSVAAVKDIRHRYRRPDTSADEATEHGREWTADEIAVAVDRSLSAAEAAHRLGRTVNAVRRRRVLHKAHDQPVPDDLHGTLHAYGVYGCRCEPCRQAQRDRSSQRRH